MDQDFINQFEDFLAAQNIDIYGESVISEDKYRFDGIYAKKRLSDFELRLKLVHCIEGYNREYQNELVKLTRISTNEVSDNGVDFTFDVTYTRR